MKELEYENLYAMLRSNGQAWEYFSSLPDYARDHISSCGSNIGTFSLLCTYGENIQESGR